MRKQVERDGVREDAGRDRAVAQHVVGLFQQFLHRLRARAAGRLIGGGDDAADRGQLAQGRDGHQHHDRGAVRVGDDAPVRRDVFRVDLRDDERHFGVHAERARSCQSRPRPPDGGGRELSAARAARREEGDVNALETVFASAVRRGAACPENVSRRPADRSEASRRRDCERKFARFQQVQKLGSDGSGRAGNGDVISSHSD